MEKKAKPAVPVWTLATQKTHSLTAVPPTDNMSPEVLQGLRTALAAMSAHAAEYTTEYGARCTGGGGG